MLCKECNLVMKSGTTYEIKNEKVISRRFDECPKCHFRKYNKEKNTQEKTKTGIQKSKGGNVNGIKN